MMAGGAVPAISADLAEAERRLIGAGVPRDDVDHFIVVASRLAAASGLRFLDGVDYLVNTLNAYEGEHR